MSSPVKPATNTPGETEFLEVLGARMHNLKNIDVTIPRDKLVVITGLSGSGKSSLAFDTIYAEGQRRYIESFSSYARQFLGNMERPDVDYISGLSPVVSIEQKTVNRNPRSTVGTITEIYDFLRLLFAKIADAYSYVTGEKMVKYSDPQIAQVIREQFDGKSIYILAPLVKGRKGHYKELFEKIRKQGFLKVRVDGEIQEITTHFSLDRFKTHDIEVVIDLLTINDNTLKRFNDSMQLALKEGKGVMMILEQGKVDARHFSRSLMCPTSGVSYDEPAPNLFSFNSPYGSCTKCNGLGVVSEIDTTKLTPNKKLSIKRGGIAVIGQYKNTWIFNQLEALGDKYGFNLDSPIEELSNDVLDKIFYGTEDVLKVKSFSSGTSTSYSLNFEGIINFILRHQEENSSESFNRWIEGFMNQVKCPTCNGSRLKKEALYFKIEGKNISDLANMSIAELYDWFIDIESKFNEKQNIIAAEILKEIRNRTHFLLDVGLDYLTINRSSSSLSGGEAQRIRLATQIGTQLVGVMYILDEPSIGLHQKDNARLISALKDLRDIGNSVIVVEHDKEMILSADHIIDIGPGAGIHGGKIMAEGAPSNLKKFSTLTADYILGRKEIKIPDQRREGSGKMLALKNATGHNLKNISINIPLGKFVCVTGVSGSGKSSLINETLYPILNRYFYRTHQKPLPYKSIEGIEFLDKVIEIDQSPIGRTPRSNPATYTNLFTDIRTLFSELPESKIRGYKPGRFSFNVKGGRCETCGGAGLKTIEMNFLPDVYVNCETCNGKRYNRETLEVRYKGKSISDVLDMTIEQAEIFFEAIPSIQLKIKALNEVGLGYLSLGQQSTTLSGGEAQRVKLATELSKKQTGNTIYILDEPTTGLHFEDIRILLEILNRLVDNGNTVLVIEHNMDIIKVADHIIDIGPDGGSKGGSVVFEGTPENLIKCSNSHTGIFLKHEFLTTGKQNN